jgi:hypothetical protein
MNRSAITVNTFPSNKEPIFVLKGYPVGVVHLDIAPLARIPSDTAYTSVSILTKQITRALQSPLRATSYPIIVLGTKCKVYL